MTYEASRLNKRNSAYTLIELAVVMAVLGAIAIAASTTIHGTNAVASMEARQEAESLAYLFRSLFRGIRG